MAYNPCSFERKDYLDKRTTMTDEATNTEQSRAAADCPNERFVMPEFGGKVKFKSKYRRRIKIEHRKNKYSDRTYAVTIKYWDAEDTNGEGIFIGTRTLQNGQRDCDYECGYTFSPEEHFTAALICPGPRSNPIYVPLDAIEA